MLRRFSLSDLNPEEKMLFALLCFVSFCLPLATTAPHILALWEPAKITETKLESQPVAQLSLAPSESTEVSQTSSASENSVSDVGSILNDEGFDKTVEGAEAILSTSVTVPGHDDHATDNSNRAEKLLDGMVIPIQYSLPEPTGNADGSEKETAGSFKIRKSVSFGSNSAGTALITVDSSSRLLMDSKDVRDLLKRNSANETYLKQLPQSGLLSFQTMRSMGIDMRYNPTTDTVLVNLN